jgi:hypothetical protein
MEHRVRAHDAGALAEVALEQVDRVLELGDVRGGRAAHRLLCDGSFEHATCP